MNFSNHNLLEHVYTLQNSEIVSLELVSLEQFKISVCVMCFQNCAQKLILYLVVETFSFTTKLS